MRSWVSREIEGDKGPSSPRRVSRSTDLSGGGVGQAREQPGCLGVVGRQWSPGGRRGRHPRRRGHTATASIVAGCLLLRDDGHDGDEDEEGEDTDGAADEVAALDGVGPPGLERGEGGGGVVRTAAFQALVVGVGVAVEVGTAEEAIVVHVGGTAAGHGGEGEGRVECECAGEVCTDEERGGSGVSGGRRWREEMERVVVEAGRAWSSSGVGERGPGGRRAHGGVSSS